MNQPTVKNPVIRSNVDNCAKVTRTSDSQPAIDLRQNAREIDAANLVALQKFYGWNRR